jgi:hypothetical protein
MMSDVASLYVFKKASFPLSGTLPVTDLYSHLGSSLDLIGVVFSKGSFPEGCFIVWNLFFDNQHLLRGSSFLISTMQGKAGMRDSQI